MKVVVVGLGLVGIPVAASFAQEGHDVVGIDIDPRKVMAINAGENPLPTREEDLDKLLHRVVTEGSLQATKSYDTSGDADAFVVCVDTPVNPDSNAPDYTVLRSVLEDVARRMRPGALVAIESTLAPGTMETLARPVLEAGSGLRVHEDFHLVHSPERVTAGRLLYNLTHLDRVVGGNDPRDRQRALELYQGISQGRLLETDWISAELSKTVENAYRDVQLAFANEVARICEGVGADAFAVRELVNSSPGRAMLLPGPGVGGHCLSKDALLLASSAGNGARLLLAAREINEGMLHHVAALVKGLLESDGARLESSRVILLGGAYKEDVVDTSNSPGLALYGILKDRGAEVRLHDPYMPELDGVDLWRDLPQAAEGADCLVLVTAHDVYREVDWKAIARGMGRRLLVDCRGVLAMEALARDGFRAVGLGRAGGG